jgi:hypothetical protein
MPVNGLMQWHIAPRKTETLLTWEYRVWGAEDTQLEAIADPVNSVLGQQYQALLSYLDKEATRRH